MTPKDLTTFRLDSMDDKIDKGFAKIDSSIEKLDEKISALDSKYASKLSEKVLYGTIATILAAVLAKMLHLINL